MEEMTGKKKKKKKSTTSSSASSPESSKILQANLSEANLTAPSTMEIPLCLQRYMLRCLKTCGSNEESDFMQVAIRRKLREGGMCNLDLWKIDWDSMAVFPSPSLDKSVLGEDQNKKPDEVTKKDEKSKEAEEEDISTNSIMEGPQSSANMSLPTPLSQPPSFSPKHQPHASSLSQPRVPQPQSSHHHPSSSSLLETMGRPTTSQDK
jgi:hypothetical protein